MDLVNYIDVLSLNLISPENRNLDPFSVLVGHPVPHPGLREHYGRRMLLGKEESRIQEPLQFNQTFF